MISYQPKDWFTFIFRFHRADTLRKLGPLIFGIVSYTFLVSYIELEYLNLADNSEIKNLSLMHSLLSFIISLLLVFRTNTAYERWWEGRKQWGQLVNSSRSLSMKLHAMLPSNYEPRDMLRQIIPAYAFVLAYHLKNDKNKKALTAGLEWLQLKPGTHYPNQVLKKLTVMLQQAMEDGVINGQHWLGLNAEIQSFADDCGACERIRNTPIPYSYSVFLKKFIFFYVMTLPFSMVRPSPAAVVDPGFDQRRVSDDVADGRIDLGHGHAQEPHQYSPSLGNSEIRDMSRSMLKTVVPQGRSAMRI